ncbi:stimulator of interferon genes protein isoform X1 [Coregonus clupeaformis]|uniref:stimulator of interferon genes protein isoform X1 n=1 Tax=Coregonus clupeaformis TaxID=59861 RepID=UPI001BDFEF49|nr:stimulator of interferon genes protein isoform X1 [Coregonus clupeaformis]
MERENSEKERGRGRDLLFIISINLCHSWIVSVVLFSRTGTTPNRRKMQQLGGEECLVPQPRGSLPKACAIGLATVVTVAILVLEPECFFRHVAAAILILTVGPSLHGVFLLSEECLHHANTRYRGGRLGQMVTACVGVCTLLGVGLAVLLFVLTKPQPWRDQWSMVILACVLYPLLKTLGVLGPSEVEVSEICEKRKMNVAHGLAWSFHLGYLNLVLPRLEGSIAEFRASNMVGPFETKGSRKLLILLPLNANITHKLEDADTNINFHDNLPNTEIDRAGVRGRVYKHSVYSVLDKDRQVHHCVVEYATPLLTLYKMSQESSAGFGEKDRREQVLLFYRTLQDILDRSLECRNRYRLILLNDEHEDDPHFLSKAILKNLDQQEKEEFYVPPVIPQPEVGRPSHALPLIDYWHRAEPMSREPTLMISHDMPRTLREPVENSEDLSP